MSWPNGGGRNRKRSDFSQADRVTLLEQDVDSIERAGATLAAGFRRLYFAVLAAILTLGVTAIMLGIEIARGR